mgnify:CR=1 FL=1
MCGLDSCRKQHSSGMERPSGAGTGTPGTLQGQENPTQHLACIWTAEPPQAVPFCRPLVSHVAQLAVHPNKHIVEAHCKCAVLDRAHLDCAKPTNKQKVGFEIWLLHNTCAENSGMQCIPGRTKQPLFKQSLISPILPLTCCKQQLSRSFPGFCTERR